MSDTTGPRLTRRSALVTGAAGAAILAAPMGFVRHAWAADKKIGNFPVEGPNVVFGFNVPQTGAYADEGADELRAYQLAVKHLNEGGGMLATMKPSKLTGQGVLGKKVTFVQRRHPDEPRRRAHRRPPHDRARQGDHVQRLLVHRPWRWPSNISPRRWA